MAEINLGGGDDDSDSGGGGMDVTQMLDQLEEVQSKLMENPQLAQMFGVELGDLQENMENANEAAEESGVELDHEFLSNLLDGVRAAGFGDMTLDELAEYVEKNPDQIDSLIDQYT